MEENNVSCYGLLFLNVTTFILKSSVLHKNMLFGSAELHMMLQDYVTFPPPCVRLS